MKFEKTDVWGFSHALRGMRNPLDSHARSDSDYRIYEDNKEDDLKIMHGDYYRIGENDMGLAQRLINAGSEHRKFMRQIMVSVDITAPLYWWKEFDTYKIGTVANSCSTMHTITKYPITMENFEIEDYDSSVFDKFFFNWQNLINALETLRKMFIETKDKRYWKELVRLLPTSWLQKRTVTLNYENLLSIYRQRKNHKLIEWEKCIEWVRTLPYSKELIFLKGDKDEDNA